MGDIEKRADPAVASMTEEADLDAPACGTVSVDMSAFDDDEDMALSCSSESSKPKRGRNSPAKGPVDGTKVRILPLRMRAFLLFVVGVLEAFFYRGVRKVQISLPVASRSICFFGAWRWAKYNQGPGLASKGARKKKR